MSDDRTDDSADDRIGGRLRRIISDDELDSALAALRDDVPVDRTELDRARVALLTAAADPGLAAPSAPPTVNLPAGPRRRSGRRWLAAAAAVLVLGTGGAVAQSALLGGGTQGSTAAAAELNAAADKVRRVADPVVAPGRYRYLKTRTWDLVGTENLGGGPSFLHLAETVRETWVPADQSDTWLERRTTTGNRKWFGTTEAEAVAAGYPGQLTGRSVETWQARCGGFFAVTPCAEPGGWGNPTPAWIADLPRDPQRLYERLRADAPRNSRGDMELLIYAADALRSGLLPSDVRSSLYRALALVPGLEITDRAANLDGRIGIAYGMADDTTREEIIVDPGTGEFIGERDVSLRDLPGGLKAGDVGGHSAVSTAVVDRIGTPPPS